MKKNYINTLGIVSFFLGIIGFMCGLITISLGYNILFSILLIVNSLLIAVQSSVMFTYPHGKVLQEDELSKLRRKYEEATVRLYRTTNGISDILVKRIIEEIDKEIKWND